MAEQNPAIFLQGGSHPAEDVRRFISTVAGDRPGFVGAGDLAVTQTGTASMGVSVASGRAFIGGTENTYQGLYFVENRGAKTLTITPSDATNDRLDLVVARVKDAAYSGTLSEWALEVIPGTAQPTPEEPAVPENALVLAKITVGHGVTSITGADIEDRRLTTLGQGIATGLHGILVAASSTLPASGDFEGQHAYETDTDRVRVWDGTRWRYIGDRVIVSSTAQRDALPAYDGLEALVSGHSYTYKSGAWKNTMAIGQARQTIASTGLAGSAWHTIPFNTVDADSHGGFSGSRYTVAAGQDGDYLVEGKVQANGSRNLNARIILNGASFPTSTGNELNNGVSATTGTKVLTLKAGDYVELQGWSSTGTWDTAVFTDAASYLTVVRVR